MKSKTIGLTAVIGALYSALVILLAPISFGPLQLRIADCLIPLAGIFGLPAILGVSLGAFIGNAYFMYFTGPIDVILGTVANLISAFIIFKLRKNLLLASILGSITVGIIVGGYLWIYFPPPIISNLPILGMIISITLSSLIVMTGLGYVITKAVEKTIGGTTGED